MLVRNSGKLTPIDPPISAVGTGVIATDSDIKMDKAESAPVRHMVVLVLSGCSFYDCKIRSFSDFVFENIHSFYFSP